MKKKIFNEYGERVFKNEKEASDLLKFKYFEGDNKQYFGYKNTNWNKLEGEEIDALYFLDDNGAYSFCDASCGYSYNDLINNFCPNPLSKKDYLKSIKKINQLAGRTNLTEAQEAYLELLSIVVLAYEELHGRNE